MEGIVIVLISNRRVRLECCSNLNKNLSGYMILYPRGIKNNAHSLLPVLCCSSCGRPFTSVPVFVPTAIANDLFHSFAIRLGFNRYLLTIYEEFSLVAFLEHL